MGSVNIIVIGLMVYDVILTAVCAKLFSTASENKFKSDIDRIKIEYLEKKCNLSIDSIDLLTKSLKDLNGIVKKFVVGNEDTADTKPDTSALIAGWKADEPEKQELFSADEVRDSIVNACNSGMFLQSALLAQGFAQTQCIYPLQQSAIMPPMWNTSNVSRKLGD
jgi:hypothetical protein